MKKGVYTILLIINYSLLIIHSTSAQPAMRADGDSSRLRISLLTCTPGEELYSTFGHSAFRVIDSNSVTDLVYNYGTFNFNDDGFYIKFIRGKLLYYVSEEHFHDFAAQYRYENRGITEQVLNLSGTEKKVIRNFLNNNIKEENKFYKYDFFFDNCTSRLRDIIKKQQDSVFCNKPVMPPGSRFRQAIHEYLDRSGKAWSKLGIDILLGLPCDAVMTAEQMQFLPDNLMKSLDSSNNDHRLVLREENLYPIKETNDKGSFFTPLVVFSLLFVFIIAMGFIKNKFTHAFLQGFDGILFFLTGALGIVLILMWTCTDHSMCKNNFNLLWAWPTHFIMAFFVNSKKQWVKRYFVFYGLMMMVLLLAWFFLPQQMNNALIPLVLLLIYRSVIKFLANN